MGFKNSKDKPNNSELGTIAEEIATNYLKGQGYQIEVRNWRYRRAEIDIICRKDQLLIFVEVKYRSYDYYGTPDMSVDARKEALLLDAATAYAQECGHDWAVRFDIVTLTGDLSKPAIHHIPDAFFPTIE